MKIQSRPYYLSFGYRSIIPLALLFLFAYTGVAKLSGHGLFVYQLQKILHNRPLAVLSSYTLPVAELTVAALLCFERTRYTGLLLSALLLLFFTGYVIVVLSGKSVPCSCGGVIASMNWKQHLCFNIFFLAVSLLALYHYKLFTRVQGSKLKTYTE